MTATPPPPFAADLLSTQLGQAYARYDASARATHLALLAEVTSPAEVALDIEDLGPGHWRLTICAADAVGALSLIAGLLTSTQLDVVAADVFTVQVPAPTATTSRRPASRTAAPRNLTVRRILDVFTVSTSLSPPAATWARLREELHATFELLAQGRGDEAWERVAVAAGEVLRDAGSDQPRLWPLQIDTTPNDDGDVPHTALHIVGQDTPGFLFAITNALATMGVNIARAEISTVGGESRDTLWVTDASGQPLRDEARLRQVQSAVTLIKQFTALLPHAPNPALALRQFGALTRQLLAQPDWAETLPALAAGGVQQTLAELLGASEFLWEDFLRMQHATLFPLIAQAASAPPHPTGVDALRANLRAELGDAIDATERRRVLNAFKDREMFRIDLRHITGAIDFRSFADELSDLADAVIGTAADLVHDELASTVGRSRDTDSREHAWAIFGLGKLGGREIGLASDIELLFVYEPVGTTGGTTTIPAAEYFEDFVRTFLDTITTRREGIFEVDLRLRPYGDHGSLAVSEDGLAAYYRTGGSALPFERMALVKLRHIAGDSALAARVAAIRDRFVYSGAPVDYDDLIHLRARQARELVTAGAVSAKHSAGGVVDIEYRVQAAQIEAGVTDPAVRTPSTLDAIARLAAGGHLDAESARRMAAAYAFLRRLIDALRVVRGHARDLTIPLHDSREFAYLARRLELEPAALAAAIEQEMAVASAVWAGGRGTSA